MFNRAFPRLVEEMSKKMYSAKNLRSLISVLGYTFPTLHLGKQSYVDFYYRLLIDGKIYRKKYHLDKLPTRQQRRTAGIALVKNLTKKLQEGWRPGRVETVNFKGRLTVAECLQKYIKRIQQFGKKKTIHSYTTGVNTLSTYLNNLKDAPEYIDQVDTAFINEYLDWLVDERGVSPRTRNNYREWMYCFCEWMKSRKYIDTNPCADVEKVRTPPKTRKSLSKEQLNTLFDYLKKTDKNFLLACMFEYYTLIRPNELHYIKLSDINIKEQRIFVSAEISKNNRSHNVALNKIVILQMIENGVFNHPANYYLFGKDFRPSMKIAPYNLFSLRWEKVREALGWSKEYKFYSLKDSGIRDLANSHGIVVARNQARHTDISTTNKYLEGADSPVAEEAKQFKGAFAK